MSKIAFLVNELPTIDDGNSLRLANATLASGHEPYLCRADSLSLHHGAVTLMGYQVVTPLLAFEPMAAMAPFQATDFDVIWVLSLGMRESFLDKFQLLHSVNAQVRIVNSLNAIMHLKSKYFLASLPDLITYPESHAASDPNVLREIIETGGDWIAKPPAGSLGRDVFRLNAGDPNLMGILESLCGFDHDRYVLLQRRVPEIDQGEKRVLFSAGKVVGQYHRTAGSDHRTNLMQGGVPTACSLTAEEQTYCDSLGAFLKDQGAEFVGLDLAYPYVIEFNVINPGGIATIESLTGEDLAPAVVQPILGPA